jgi:hypothetical protein
MRARWHAPTENNRNPLIMKKIRTRGAPGSEMTPDPSAKVPFNETFRQLNEMLKSNIARRKEGLTKSMLRGLFKMTAIRM